MKSSIELFEEFLKSQSKASRITVKNYLSDINKFVKWFESTYSKKFAPEDLTAQVIKNFSSPEFSPRSLERYISTLKRFTKFLIDTEQIKISPFTQEDEPIRPADLWSLKEFRNFLYVNNASKHTTKNYLVDISAFTTWLDTNHESLSIESVNKYKDTLLSIMNMSESTVNRKLSSIRKYLKFLSSKNITLVTPPIPIANDNLQKEALSLEELDYGISSIQESIKYSSFPPLRLLQKSLWPYLALENLIANKIAVGVVSKRLIQKAESGISERWHHKIWYHARFTRPEWYKKYHSISGAHYLHFAILIIYASIVGFMLYDNLIGDPDSKSALAAPISPPRVLSFQGRLTDVNNNPITTSTNVRFIVYNSATASGSALLWQDTKTVTPNVNGVFDTLLGTSPNSIPSTLFREHDSLYLGISIGTTSELTPRQRIASVAYAANSESLQGMLPTTDSSVPTTNAILALDSSGFLSIGGSASPTFQATGGQFKLSGQPLLLSTNTGSNGNIQLIPDGNGRIDLQSPLVNNGSRGLIAPGGVEINDRAAIMATESAVAAFIVNNNTTGGDIFAASSSGTTRFILSNTGDISLQAGVSIDTLSTGTLSIGGTNGTTISLGRSGQGITLPGFTGQNGILYGTYGTGALAQATTATTGQCLVSGAQNPTWGSCGDDVFTVTSGAIRPNNSTLDLLIGGTSTAAAKFAILGVNDGLPVASLSAGASGTIVLTAGTSTIGTVNMKAFRVGGSTTGQVIVSAQDFIRLGAIDSNVEISTDHNSGLRIFDTSGTAPTAAPLSISGGIGSNAAFIVNQTNSGDLLTASSAGTTRFVIQNDGDVGIGTSTPGVALHINSTSDTDILRLQDSDGTCNHNPEAGSETVTCSSDERLKSNIRDAADVLPTLMNLNIRDYLITSSGDELTGVIAQEVRLVAPNMVTEDENGILSVKLPSPWILLKAIQETVEKTNFAIESLNSLQSSFVSIINSELANISTDNLISPIASIDTLRTNIISPLSTGGEISIKGNLAIEGNLQIDGDASISGNLSTESISSSNIQTENATISGTLYANNIRANSIEGLDARINSLISNNASISSVSAQTISMYHEQLATSSSSLIASIENESSLIQTQLLDVESISADFATFREGLIALGPATFNQATFIDSISIGTTLIIGENSIDTLGRDLEIQPLKGGAISLMAGALRIETDGSIKFAENVNFAKDVTVEGRLAANILSPLPDQNLQIQDDTGLTVAEVSQNGDITASGAATFSKLNLSLVEPAFAISDIESVATGSAGLGIIKKYRSELTIRSPHVTEKSLIYVSPVGSTTQIPYLLRQNPGVSFTVGINTPVSRDIQFNWIIVN